MRFRKIKYLKAKNILCYGNKGIEIDFTSLDNIIIIKGKDLDTGSSNGSGKSSLADVISYILYGKTIKKSEKLHHGDVIHNSLNKDGLYGEIIIDNYRIVRTRSKNKGTLDLWKSDKGIWNDSTKITSSKIQKVIIEDVIGISYETFINIFIFADDNSSSFLECGSAEKREIIENLLSLEKYREYHENANNILKSNKITLKELNLEEHYEKLEIETCEKRIQDLITKELSWKITLNNEISSLKSKLNSTDFSQEIVSLEDKKSKLMKFLQELENKLSIYNDNDILDKLNKIESSIRICKSKIQESSVKINQIGQKCPVCNGIILEENLGSSIENAKNIVTEQKTLLENLNFQKTELSAQLESYITSKNKIQNYIKEYKDKISILNNEILDKKTKTSDVFIQAKLEIKEKETSPYTDIIKQEQKNLENKIKNHKDKLKSIKEIEENILYYEFWVKAFGDEGIRKYIIDDIIPVLNSKINYWLSILINNKLKLCFDSSLQEHIDRYPFDGKVFKYHGLSNGQRRRLILALSQAFAYLMMMSSGNSLSLLFLDEVSMNMDKIGIDVLYKMICELAKEKQVFVIDHNENLLKMFEDCETIHLQMKNGSTEIVDKFDI